MIHNVIFSKDRFLQLQGHLDSLSYYSGQKSEHIFLILPDFNKQYFNEITKKHPWINFLYEKDEGNFNQCLHRILDHIDIEHDLILFGVDDLVYLREFNTGILDELHNHPDALSYTLRLGTNVLPYQTFWNTSRDKRLIKYDWRDKPSHYGYPFEVSNSAYRASLFKEILDVGGDKIQIPNDLESIGVQYCLQNKRNQPYTLMTNGLSYSACADLNRVQSKYPNRIQGGQQHTAENLLKLYKDGYRMDWTKYHHMEYHDCFIGDLNFELKKI